MDKYSVYGECGQCGTPYMKINPMIECKDETGKAVRVCLNCYESKYKNKFGNVDNTEDVYVH